MNDEAMMIFIEILVRHGELELLRAALSQVDEATAQLLIALINSAREME